MECKPLHCEEESPAATAAETHHSLTGVAWLTPGQYLRSFEDLDEQPPLPPWCCVLISCLGLCANWVGLVSRLEWRCALGSIRSFKSSGFEPLAFDVKALSLGCGNCPLLDLWPLALTRTALRELAHLAVMPFADTAVVSSFTAVDDL